VSELLLTTEGEIAKQVKIKTLIKTNTLYLLFIDFLTISNANMKVEKINTSLSKLLNTESWISDNKSLLNSENISLISHKFEATLTASNVCKNNFEISPVTDKPLPVFISISRPNASNLPKTKYTTIVKIERTNTLIEKFIIFFGLSDLNIANKDMASKNQTNIADGG
jgi:hypothetical protein